MKFGIDSRFIGGYFGEHTNDLGKKYFHITYTGTVLGHKIYQGCIFNIQSQAWMIEIFFDVYES